MQAFSSNSIYNLSSNNNLMTNSSNRIARVERMGYPDSPPAIKPGFRPLPKVKNITLETGTLTSIWYDTKSAMQAVDFSINGQNNIRKAVYQPSVNEQSFEDWLKEQKSNKFNLLVIEEGEKIDNLGQILIRWSQMADGMHRQSMVVFDAHGITTLTTMADNFLEIDSDGEVETLYLDY